MSQLTIFKASAGSGKTFRLVLEYLKLLIENPYNYRHTLAVTFTNKATTEMKERILRDLFKVSQYQDLGILELLTKETGISQAKIAENAQLALSNILHDYDRFAVSTIDSFFQRILRTFARETGLYGTYEVDLDQDAVLEEACDRLLLSVEDDLPLRNWLLSMSEDQLGEGKNWQIRDKILELGKELHKEPFQKYLVHQSSAEVEREKLDGLKRELVLVRKAYEKQIRGFGNKALKIISDADLQASDFKGGSRSFVNYFAYWAAFRTDKLEPTATILKAIDEPDNWSTKTSKKKEQIETCFHSGLNQVLKETIDFIDNELPLYLTANEIFKYLYSLGVLSILANKVREVGHEKNSLLLSEGNLLLNGIIGNNDAPFIYEKAGNFYHYFMFDEFQDTSLTQWQNFKPLVLNSLAENHPNLVVGDVKQSIYRWRNSDWQLLNKRLKEELNTFKIDEITLEGNWRSRKNVVLFNNWFFQLAKTILQESFNKGLVDTQSGWANEYRETIFKAFADVEQKPSSGKEGGYVEVNFIDNENKADYEKQTYEHLITAIEKVQDRGFRAGDIAILVKKNSHGRTIAEALLSHKKEAVNYNFEVISDDTLYIDTSSTVRFIVGLMRYILNPFDQVVQATIVYEYAANLLPLLEKQGKAPQRIVGSGQQQLGFDHNANSSAKFISELVRNDYFSFFEKGNKDPLVQKWSNCSLTDLIEELIQRYNLDYLSGEQANLQALKDVVNDFTKKESGNLHRFIEWWNQFGNKVKVQTVGQRDAIRILTIHKSKGLEFPIVMVPFCDWGFPPDAKKTNILWCSTNTTRFNQFPVLPVKYSNNLKNTFFNIDYYTETLLSYIDNMNVLYVASTRAIDGLFLFTETLSKEKDTTVSGLFDLAIRKTESPILMPVEDSYLTYVLGELVSSGREQREQSEVNLSGKVNRQTKISEALKLRRNYDDFLDEGASKRSLHINEGKRMHELLSNIKTSNDIDDALLMLINDGKAEADQYEALKVHICTLLKHAQALHWFDGSYKVLNETSIITPDYGLLRPDRVMIKEKQVVVVDYKTTASKSKLHQHQVKGYADKISAMGFDKVEGYVWYLKSNEIVNIEEEF